MMNEELTKLIQQAVNGDSAAFEQVMQIKARQIIYISVKLMRNRQDGEDAAQEAMLKMYQHLGELKNPEAFQGWMSQIITRTCIDMKRKQNREDYDYLETEDEVNEMRREFLPQEYIEDVDKRAFLMEVIDDLPEKYRACLLFYYYEGMSHQQVAQAMGTTEKVVDNILQRARRRIRKQLDKKYKGSLSMASFQGAAAIPVLSQLFQMDEALQTSPETIARILSGAGAALGLGSKAAVLSGAAGASGASGTGGVSSAAGQTLSQAASQAVTQTTGQTASAAAGGLNVSAKILIGIVATATAAGGAAVTLFPGNETGLPDSPPGQAAAAILTLEDMIGEEAADKLRNYAAGDGRWEEWPAYLEGLAVAAHSSLTAEDAKYTLYRLTRQDKQLLILEKSWGEQLETTYHFTDIQEEIPERGDLMRSMEGWSR